MSHVYVANFGEANAMWPVAKAKSVILTINSVRLHPFWQRGDREGFVDTAMSGTVTARMEKPSRPTAGRWWNLMEEVRDTEDDLWITRQGLELWWTASKAGELREELQASTNTKRDGAQVWRLEKDCQPWSNRDGQGRRLLWNAIHPKAKDFLVTEATFQRIANDRGYADYVRALVAGQPLTPWETSPLFKDKLAASKRPGYTQLSPREISAENMVSQIFSTVAQSNGQIVERVVKDKMTDLTREEWKVFLLRMLDEQNGVCAITGLPFQHPGEGDDKEMRPSLDRIDSGGHYTTDNVQIVCRFMNRWKNADKDVLVRRLIGAIRSVPTVREMPSEGLS